MSNLNNNTAKLEALLAKVNALPEGGGIDLPALTNEATAVDLLSTKQLISSSGTVVIGSMPNNGALNKTMDGINTKSITVPKGYTSGGTVSLDNTIDNEVTEQTDLISQIRSVVDSLPEAGSGGGSIETCTVELSTSEGSFTSVLYSKFENGEVEGCFDYYSTNAPTNLSITNVICGSALCINQRSNVSPENVENMERLGYSGVNNWKITAKSGEIAKVSFYNPF